MQANGKFDDATKAYDQAPRRSTRTAAGQYYYNLGALLTNAGKVDDANAAFDKCYRRRSHQGRRLLSKGPQSAEQSYSYKDGKMVAPPGTAEAFQ